MNKLFPIFAILFLLAQINLSAQTEKGKILLGISSALGLNGGQTGFAISSTKTKSDSFESDPSKSFSFNLSPRTGYFFTDNLATGLELSYTFFSLDRPDIDPFIGGETKFNQYSVGPFIRYYFQGKTIKPIIEGGVSFGKSTNTVEGANPVDGGDLDFDSNIFSFGGGAGIAVFFGNQVSFDTMLVYLNSQTKPTDNNDNNSRSVLSSFGLRLGFSIYLGNSSAANQNVE